MSPASEPVERLSGPLSEPSGYGELLAGSLGLPVLVIVAAVALVWVVRRLSDPTLPGGKRGRQRWMEVLARLPLEPRRSLYVVRISERTLLLGTSEMGLTLLRELGPQDLPAADAAKDPSFSSLVAQATSRLRAVRARGEGPAEGEGAGGAADRGADASAEVGADAGEPGSARGASEAR